MKALKKNDKIKPCNRIFYPFYPLTRTLIDSDITRNFIFRGKQFKWGQWGKSSCYGFLLLPRHFLADISMDGGGWGQLFMFFSYFRPFNLVRKNGWGLLCRSACLNPWLVWHCSWKIFSVKTFWFFFWGGGEIGSWRIGNSLNFFFFIFPPYWQGRGVMIISVCGVCGWVWDVCVGAGGACPYPLIVLQLIFFFMPKRSCWHNAIGKIVLKMKMWWNLIQNHVCINPFLR